VWEGRTQLEREGKGPGGKRSYGIVKILGEQKRNVVRRFFGEMSVPRREPRKGARLAFKGGGAGKELRRPTRRSDNIHTGQCPPKKKKGVVHNKIVEGRVKIQPRGKKGDGLGVPSPVGPSKKGPSKKKKKGAPPTSSFHTRAHPSTSVDGSQN